jgi:phytol kinase
MLEIRRQAVHLILFSLFAFLILYLPFWLSFAIAAGALAICALGAAAVVFKLERVFPKNLRLISYVAKAAERSGEKAVYKRIPFYGSIIGLIGIVASMLIVGTRAYIPILVLAWGDSASTVVGVYFGKHRLIQGRSLEGALGFFVAAVIPLFVLTSLSDGKVLFLAASATLVEIFSPVDDNLTIPIVVSALMKFLA